MTESSATDGPIDQLVKARWLEIGLSQTDLAEVLGSATGHNDNGLNGASEASVSRLAQIAEALDVPADFFYRQNGGGVHGELGEASAQSFDALQPLLALRLLRAFHELTDQQARQVLVQLAEQIVKRQLKRR